MPEEEAHSAAGQPVLRTLPPPSLKYLSGVPGHLPVSLNYQTLKKIKKVNSTVHLPVCLKNTLKVNNCSGITIVIHF